MKVFEKIPQAKGDVREKIIPEEILSRLGPARISAVVAWAWAKLRAISLDEADRCDLGLGVEPGWDWKMDMTVWEAQLGEELLAEWRRPDGKSEGGPGTAGDKAPDGSGDGTQGPVEPGRSPAHPGQAASAG